MPKESTGLVYITHMLAEVVLGWSERPVAGQSIWGQLTGGEGVANSVHFNHVYLLPIRAHSYAKYV